MTIYVDIVLIENIIMNYIILLATGIIAKAKISHLRLLCASAIGAVYSVIAYMEIFKLYSNICMKFLLSIVMIYVAFNPQKVKKLWKILLIFYVTSFTFGGTAYAMIYVIKPQKIIMKNGRFLGTYPIKVVIFAGAVAFILILIVYELLKNKKKKMIFPIKIFINNNIIKTKALLDSGNLLKDPITSTPVIVVERVLLYNIIPKEILNNIEKIIGGNFNQIPKNIQNEYTSKLKLIPFKSLGKDNGMLLGIKASKIEVEKDDDIISKNNVILGIYQSSLTKRGEYQALIGVDFL